MPVNVYWVTVVEVRWYTLDGSCLPLFITPVFMLFALAVLNLLLLRFAPRQAFNQAELLVTYLMVVISETLAGHDFVQNLFGVIGHPFQFATPENKWADFHDLLPSFFGPTDDRIIRWYYEGSGTLYSPEVLREWAVPLAYWGAMIILLMMGAVFFANLPQYVKDPYRRFLENKIRDKWDFNGTPINIFMRHK